MSSFGTDSIEVIEVHSRKVQATARALRHHRVGHFFHSVQSNEAFLYSDHLYVSQEEWVHRKGGKAYTQAGSWIMYSSGPLPVIIKSL